MGIEEQFRGVVVRSLRSLVAAAKLPPEATQGTFAVERPKRADHGDLATNAALALAKATKTNPRALAELLKGAIETDPSVVSVELAGPGFLNVKLRPSAYHDVLREVHRAGAGYGRAPAASGQRVLLEFVSANPTGPLLISHARGALVGDAIGRVLEANGHLVSREYYINDFGNQLRSFARSVLCATAGLLPPADGYPGAYVTALGDFLKVSSADLLGQLAGLLARSKPGVAVDKETKEERPVTDLPAPLDQAEEDAMAELGRRCVTRMLDGVPGSSDLPGIRSTLRALRVHHDTWYSEEGLHRWGRVPVALEKLEQSGFVHTLADGAMVFRMPEGEGEKDEEHKGTADGGRVLRKNDGKTFTYFASDIAYHADKVSRGYDRIINVLGADHHGYVPRLRNVMRALGLPHDRFDVVLFQLVSLVKEGKPYRLSKRRGNLITTDDVLEEIDEALGPGAGADALRYFYLSRRTDNPVVIDVDIATKASIDNPSIYLQYGHARFCSLLRKGTEVGFSVPTLDEVDLSKLTHPLELSMIQHLGTYPQVVRDAVRELMSTGVIGFLNRLGEDFNAYWTQTWKARDYVLPPTSVRAEDGWQEKWDGDKTRARLFLVDQLRSVYAAGLALVGIRSPERIERIEQPAADETAGAETDGAADPAANVQT